MTLRVGFIGVGRFAHIHLDNIANSDLAEVVAVCDVNEERVQEVAQKYGAASYTDYAAMCDRESLDAVFLCVPPFAHGVMEEYVAERGVHLFVEKPLGLSLPTVVEKARRIRESGVVVDTGYCLRYTSIVQEARAYLSGRTVAMVSGYYHTRFVAALPWWRSMEKSGGQLVGQSTHTIDLMRYLCGPVTQVHAFMSLGVMSDIEGIDIPDCGVLNLTFAGGAVGQMSTTITQPDHHSGVTVYGRDFRLNIAGLTLTIVEGDRVTVREDPGTYYRDQDEAFLHAVRTGDRSRLLAPYEEAMETLAVTLAANRSHQVGGVVDI